MKTIFTEMTKPCKSKKCGLPAQPNSDYCGHHVYIESRDRMMQEIMKTRRKRVGSYLAGEKMVAKRRDRVIGSVRGKRKDKKLKMIANLAALQDQINIKELELMALYREEKRDIKRIEMIGVNSLIKKRGLD